MAKGYAANLKRLMALTHKKQTARRPLDEVAKLSKVVGSPEKELKVVHVAGTNGKGSVCLALSHILQEAGYKVGLFTSPHVVDLCERIQISGSLIEKSVLAKKLGVLLDAAENSHLSLHFFDVLTVLALSYFKEEGVDIAVIETGLGGEFDATNIVFPMACAITSLGMDHMEVLGGSLVAIAKAKAGIIKRQVPVVLGSSSRHEVVLKKASDMTAPVQCIEKASPYEENQNIAKALAHELNRCGFLVDEEAIKKGVKKPLFYRYEKVGPVIIDGAHNGEALRAFFQRVQGEHPGKALQVIAACSSERVEDVVKALKAYKAYCHIWPHGHERLAKQEVLLKQCQKEAVEASLYSSKKACLEGALKKGAQVVAAGSFYILGDVKQEVLSIAPVLAI
jgi:dihydrofolate synthase / folylpolyglutamate synthase